MRARLVRIISAVLLAMTLLMVSILPAAALDDTYRFDDFGMSIKLPKSFYVVTRDTARDDAVFGEINSDYDTMMTAFNAANIYLYAYDSEKTCQLSLTVTEDTDSKTVNNYSDLTPADREAILNSLLSDDTVSTAADVKHSGNIFFDYERRISEGGKTTYINLSNTIINGLRIDISLQKDSEPLTPQEAKILTNAANSLKFDEIKRNTGAVFDWWRLLLWAAILAGFAVAISVIYRQHNASKQRLAEERRIRRASGTSAAAQPQPAHAADEAVSFDEALGYKDDEEFAVRADADEMAGYDIKVAEKDPAKGIAFFEDEGSGIDDGSDYFDTYFKEPVEKRSRTQRFFSAIGMYLKSALTHTGYFFKNLFNKLFKKKNK